MPKAAVLAQMGLAQQQLGQLAEALRSYRQAHGLTPSAELAERIKTLQAAVERPEPIEQLLLHAMQTRQSGRVRDAIKVFRAALQLNGDHPEALHGLGMALREMKDLSGALPMLQKAIILAPGRADYYNDLGMLFQDQGELEKAVSFHNRALRIKPDFTAACINLGVAHKRLGKFDDAVAFYRKAIVLQPQSPEAHNNLGNLLRLKGNPAAARKELQRALALRPGYADAVQNLAALEQEARTAANASAGQARIPTRPYNAAAELAKWPITRTKVPSKSTKTRASAKNPAAGKLATASRKLRVQARRKAKGKNNSA